VSEERETEYYKGLCPEAPGDEGYDRARDEAAFAALSEGLDLSEIDRAFVTNEATSR
jgi:hypothetical protein